MKQTMGEIIASKRKALGMTQNELASKMGVTDKAVSKWERELSCPDVNSLPKLASIFDMTVDELMQIKDENKQSEKKSINAITTLVFIAVSLAMGIAVVV